MSGFTKGPWTYENNWPEVRIISAGGAHIIADYDTSFVEYPDDEANEANARLIAAAPELYERLKEARDAIASLPEYALGGENIVHPHDGVVVGHYPIRDELLSNIDAALSKAAGEGV